MYFNVLRNNYWLKVIVVVLFLHTTSKKLTSWCLQKTNSLQSSGAMKIEIFLEIRNYLFKVINWKHSKNDIAINNLNFNVPVVVINCSVVDGSLASVCFQVKWFCLWTKCILWERRKKGSSHFPKMKVGTVVWNSAETSSS